MTTSAMNPILVAVDDRGLEPLLRSGAWLSRTQGRAVHVVSVLQTPTALSWARAVEELSPASEAERSAAHRALLTDALHRVLGSDPGWRVTVTHGDAPQRLAQAARDSGASLLVMGLGRRRPVDRVLGAETTLATIRLSPCPVLALSEELREPPIRVVVATDFSATCANAVLQALPLVASHAEMTFVHVWQPSQVAMEREQNDVYRRELPVRFARFVTALGLPDTVNVETEALEGNIPECVLLAAARVDADLVVAGRHGRGALERILVGSVAMRILRGTTRSAFIAPEDALAPMVALRSRGGDALSTMHPSDWAVLLSLFTQQHARRRTVVAMRDDATGTTAEERGFRLVSVSYEPQDPLFELVLGEPNGNRQVHRHLRNVRAITVSQSTDSVSATLRIRHGTGETSIGLMSEDE